MIAIVQDAVSAVTEVLIDVLIVAGAWVIMSIPAVIETAHGSNSCQPAEVTQGP